MVALDALTAEGLFTAKAQQRTEYGNQEETEKRKSPGEFLIFADNLCAVTLGATVNACGQGFLRCRIYMQMLNKGLRNLPVSGLWRKSSAAMQTKTVLRVFHDFHFAV